MLTHPNSAASQAFVRSAFVGYVILLCFSVGGKSLSSQTLMPEACEKFTVVSSYTITGKAMKESFTSWTVLLRLSSVAYALSMSSRSALGLCGSGAQCVVFVFTVLCASPWCQC